MRGTRFAMVLAAAWVVVACGSGASGGSGGSVDAHDARLPPRIHPALAWTGDGVFVFAGSEPWFLDSHYLDDGAVVSADLATSRRLPPSPFDAPLRLASATAVDGGALVVGIQCDTPGDADVGEPPVHCDPGTLAVARFDLDEFAWEPVDLPPALAAVDQTPAAGLRIEGSAHAEIVGQTPAGVVVLEIGTRRGELWAYDPSAATWTDLPDPPIEASPTGDRAAPAPLGSCVVGDRVVVAEALPPGTGAIGGPVAGVRPHVLDLATGDWRALDDLDSPLDVVGFVCLDDGLLATGTTPEGWRFDLETGGWRTVPPPPQSLFAAHPVWTGREVVFLYGEGDGEPGWALDPATGAWREVGAAGPYSDGMIAGEGRIYGVSEDDTPAGPAGELWAIDLG